MTFKYIAPAVALFCATLPAYAAGDIHYGRTAMTVENGSDVIDTFAADTPKIVLHVEILDPANGHKMTARWIAEKTQVAEPNFVIDSADVISDGDEATFSLSKPNSGWPVGDYRVDLLMDGKPGTSVHFHVK